MTIEIGGKHYDFTPPKKDKRSIKGKRDISVKTTTRASWKPREQTEGAKTSRLDYAPPENVPLV